MSTGVKLLSTPPTAASLLEHEGQWVRSAAGQKPGPPVRGKEHSVWRTTGCSWEKLNGYLAGWLVEQKLLTGNIGKHTACSNRRYLFPTLGVLVQNDLAGPRLCISKAYQVILTHSKSWHPPVSASESPGKLDKNINAWQKKKKGLTISSIGEDVEQTELLYNVKWYYFGKEFGSAYGNFKICIFQNIPQKRC